MSGREVGGVDPIARFAETAERDCAWAERTPASAEGEVETAVRLLVDLLRRGLDLTQDFADDAEPGRPSGAAWQTVYRRFAVLPVSYYGTRAPEDIVENEQSIGDLGYDLAGIWRDVRHGLDAYRADHAAIACWQWKFSFRHHGGRHATEALRVLLDSRNGQLT